MDNSTSCVSENINQYHNNAYSTCDSNAYQTIIVDPGNKSIVGKCVDGTSCLKLHNLYSNSPAPIPDTAHESNFLDTIRKLAAEALGTFLLLLVVVSSGIMAQDLSPNDVGLQLLENSIATGCGLHALILIFGPVSGAHFNPVVSFVDYLNEDMSLRDCIFYTIFQTIGGIFGVLVSNWQFSARIMLSTKRRSTSNLWLSEVIGTITLLLVIHGCLRTGQKSSVPLAVAGWVCGGYFFTSSTIFANPAVTIARMFSDSFAGIEPSSVGAFIGFQYLGAIFGFILIKFFYPKNLEVRKDDNLYLRISILDYRKNCQ